MVFLFLPSIDILLIFRFLAANTGFLLPFPQGSISSSSLIISLLKEENFIATSIVIRLNFSAESGHPGLFILSINSSRSSFLSVIPAAIGCPPNLGSKSFTVRSLSNMSKPSTLLAEPFIYPSSSLSVRTIVGL